MPLLRRTFRLGRQNKDVEARLMLPDEYRDALNMDLVHTENSDSGSLEKSLSNIRKTNLNVGTNIESIVTVGGFTDEYRDRIYWLVKSDRGCFLIEYDFNSESASFVLEETRPESTRVFALSEKVLVTGIRLVLSEEIGGDLLIIAAENMEMLCINIERAKTYGDSGFYKEDIYLAKRPPIEAPKTELIYTAELNNNMEQRFLLYAYRYRFLDGEYSALSSFTNYQFNPNPFKLDYFTNENLGMVNTYNGVRLTFNVGDKRVTDIQIVVKESKSNNIYVVETFNKKKEGWDNDMNLTEKSLIYSNNKTYAALPEMELYRTFDNVPRNAKAISLVGNRLLPANYLDGYNIQDANGNEIKIEYDLSILTKDLQEGTDLATNISMNGADSVLRFIADPTLEFKEGKRIIFNFSIVTLIDQTPVYEKSFFYNIPQDFPNLQSLWQSAEFLSFMEMVNNDYLENSNIETDDTWSLEVASKLTPSSISSNSGSIIASYALFKDATDAPQLVPVKFINNSSATLTDVLVNTSLKSNRDVEVGIIYLDDVSRKTTTLTSINNSIHIPHTLSAFQNKLQVTINSKPPYWAKRYKFVVKTAKLTYENIFINKYYQDDLYVWCKLEGDNKDKVKENDILILKKAATVIPDKILKAKVLEKKVQ